MSWDASLMETVRGRYTIRSWNYTHNCNSMMATVLEEAGHTLEKHWLIGHMGKSWFDCLNGLSGKDGYKLLKLIVDGMEANPCRFLAMNPENGWGSYGSVLKTLREMRDASKEYPHATWDVRG